MMIFDALGYIPDSCCAATKTIPDGLLSTHKNGCGVATVSVTEQRCAAPSNLLLFLEPEWALSQ